MRMLLRGGALGSKFCSTASPSPKNAGNGLLKRINKGVIKLMHVVDRNGRSMFSPGGSIMKNTRKLSKVLFLAVLMLAPSISFAQTKTISADKNQPFILGDGWNLQSSAKVPQKGEDISVSDFETKDWYAVSVPTTVVAALVKQKVFPDPDYGTNLRQLPGMTYPVGGNFSNIAMQPDSPFAVSWWYRTKFTLPASYKGKAVWLNFRGINYRANVFLNGKEIANSDQIAGAWRTYELNVTEAAKPGAINVLAVQVWAPTETDLAITFVDWNPAPPDKNMGLWREVYFTGSGPVALRYPTVVSKVDSPQNNTAHLTVTAQLKNATAQPVRGTLKGTVANVQISQDVELAPSESKDVSFDPDKFPQLTIQNPRLWWPAQMGKPDLYPLHMEFIANGQVSDASETQFGIRQVDSEVLPTNRRVFTINGKRILIRGGGWSPDMMLRENSRRLQDELRYVRDMGLNTVRLEGKLETEEFFNVADREGILVMAGWCCCDHWEHWSKWSQADYEIAKQSLTDQIYRLRSHPSLVMWLNGSDNPPPPDVEDTYLSVEKNLMWPNPVVSSATAKTTPLTGESGVKMTGPYEYVAPSYWTEDAKIGTNHCNAGGCGGSYGFNSETSPGPAVPPIESLRNFIPKDQLWPIGDAWNYHAGGGEFKNLAVYTQAQDERYGKSNSVEEFAAKSQLMGYEGIRAMYEAYSKDKYTSTGVIQWMLNNAWPSVIWHLYDYYLRPGGGYFGAKKAMEPLHPMYSYADRSVWVVSSQYEDAKNLKLVAKIYNQDMSEKFSKEQTLDAPADSTAKAIDLPANSDFSPTYFLVLRLEDSTGKLVGSNFYWLSSRQETIDWEKSTWWTTPTATFADYTSLSQLPKVKLKVGARTEVKTGESATHVTIENPSKNLAFFVRLKLNKGPNGDEVLPVVWQDNYISLLPGEKRELTATYRDSDLGGTKPTIEVSGWNAN
jgi:exo-1,4-beta-D-glucosaminidase